VTAGLVTTGIAALTGAAAATGLAGGAGGAATGFAGTAAFAAGTAGGELETGAFTAGAELPGGALVGSGEPTASAGDWCVITDTRIASRVKDTALPTNWAQRSSLSKGVPPMSALPSFCRGTPINVNRTIT
jgi:hypothetical protein